MTKNLFGLFTAVLCVVCVMLTIQCLRKGRWGLASIFLLNAFTNIVNSIHAFSGTLF